MPATTAEMLAARLELLAGDSRRILVVSARSDMDTATLAQTLGDTMNRAAETAGRHYEIAAGRGLLDGPDTVGEIDRFDGLVLAVRRGRTSRGDLEECRRLLEAAGVRLITAVLV